MIQQLTDSNFDMEVVDSNVPVIVDFYADWCGPCKIMSPVVAQIAEEYKGKIKVAKINIDENNSTAMKYRILSIPTLLFFRDGKVESKIEGAVTKAAVVSKMEKVYGSL